MTTRLLRLLALLPALPALSALAALASGATATTAPVFRVDHPNPTADKPQCKLWFAGDAWWALLPGARGPTLWQRTARGWREHPEIRRQLDGSPGRADVWFDRDGATAVTVGDRTLAVVRLTPTGSPLTAWRAAKLASWLAPTALPLETATIARDGAGRWWIAAPVTPPSAPATAGTRRPYGPDRDIEIWTSADAVSWQRLPALARGVSGDDICTLVVLERGIGVAWSDQNRDEVGFARHADEAPPETWETPERAAVGGKTADDHLHAALSPDGTLWLATKNSVDARGTPQLVLRVRSSRAGWKNLPYAEREAGSEPSRPVVIATANADTVLLGHTVYNRSDPFRGSIVFGKVVRGDARVIPDAIAVITPDPALRSRINDITAPRAPFPAGAPWIVLASDAEGRVYEADLRSLARAALPAQSAIESDLTTRFHTTAAQPATRHRGEFMRTLEPLMRQQAQWLVAQLEPSAVAPRSAMLPPTPNRPASGEHGIRPTAHVAKGLALLARLAPEAAFSAGFTRAVARDRAVALVRHLIRTHGAGGGTCADGKPWGGQWQSAYWAALAGEACWLLWDDLGAEERWLAARMICDEADRFVGVAPPANLRADSKAEENAWNSAVVSLAFNLFPAHPHHAAWHETALRWIGSSFSTRRDLSRTEIVDGRPLREWISGANVLDDFTLENHGRVHPDYMACTYLLTAQVSMYDWAGYPAPSLIPLNVDAINANLQKLATPDGSLIYPNGQDWGLRRQIDWLEYHASAAVLRGDGRSAALMRHALGTVGRMAARNPSAPIYLPSETKLSSDQAMVLEYLAHIYALMADRGEGPAPLPDSALRVALAGTHLFPAGKFGVVRTTDSIASFSWGAQVMGLVMPLRENLLLSPEARGLVGHVGVEGLKTERPVVQEVALAELPSGFGVAGVLRRGDGALEQRFGFLALPDGRVVYADRVLRRAPAAVTVLDLGTLGVLNDLNWPGHDGRRTLDHAGGTQVFVAASAERDSPVELASPWFRLEDLGIGCFGVSGRGRYVPTPSGAAGRLEQRFHLNATPVSSATQARPGEVLAHGVFVFWPGRSAAQTRAAAMRCTLLTPPAATEVRLQLDDGTLVTMELARLQVSVSPPPGSLKTAPAFQP